MTAAKLDIIDYVVVAGYLAASLAVGLSAGRKSRSLEGYLLGGRQLPWGVLLLSIVATETSTVTFLSLPGQTFAPEGDFTFLQVAFGYILGRLLLVRWLLPEYFRDEFVTAYEVLQNRFDPTVRQVASAVFLVTRNASDGLRLFLTALLLHAALGAPFVTCVVGLAAVTAIYALVGGISAVVYNDAIQLAVYLLGGVAVMWQLVAFVDGGAAGLISFAADTGRLRLFDLNLSLTAPNVTLLSGMLGGAVLSIATHGADHLMVQRYLCARSQKSAGLALSLSGFIVLAQFATFLAIGVGLAAFYTSTEVGYDPGSGDKVFLTYLVNETPAGLKGLLLAAVFAAAMSTLSSSLNASAGVAINDFRGWWPASWSDRAQVQAARVATVVFALVQSGAAVLAYQFALSESVIQSVLAIAGFSSGLLLGLYAAGMLLGKANAATGITGLLAGLAITAWVAFGTPIHWLWYSLVGVATTLGACLVLSRFQVQHEDPSA